MPDARQFEASTPTRGGTLTRGVIPLTLVLLCAAFRFSDLGFAPLRYDDAYPMYDALRMLDGGEWLLLGQPSSVFLDNPPLMSYLEAIPLLVWRSPWAVYLCIVALNTIAVIFVYQAARQILGDPVGYLAAFLFAVNPWMVFFSRTTWVQALMPLFTALIAWGLWPALAARRRSSWRVFIAALAAVAMTLAYIQAWGVLIQIGLLVIIFRKTIPRRPLFAGAAVCIAALALYGVGLASDWEANRAKLSAFVSGGKLHLTSEGIDHAARLVTGLDFEAAQIQIAEPSSGDELRRSASVVAASLLSVALIIGAGQAALAIRARSPDRTAAIVLLIWFGAPIVLTSVATRPVHPHYLLLSSPAGYVLAGWGIAPLLRYLRSKWIALATLLAIAVLFAASLYAVNQNVARHPTRPKFDGWSLAAASQVGSVVHELAQGGDYPIRIVADAHSALLSSMSGRYLRSLSGIDFPDFIALPENEPLVYLLVNTTPEPGALGPKQPAHTNDEMIFADGARVVVLSSPPYDRDEARALPETKLDWPSQAGLSLLGYTLTGDLQPGHAIECATYWRVDHLKPEQAEWFVGAFYHLVDAEGQTAANVSGHAQWSRRWQLGDVYVERTRIGIPGTLTPGEYRLEIGLFDSIHGQSYVLYSPEGPASSVAIPLRSGNQIR